MVNGFILAALNAFRLSADLGQKWISICSTKINRGPRSRVLNDRGFNRAYITGVQAFLLPCASHIYEATFKLRFWRLWDAGVIERWLILRTVHIKVTSGNRAASGTSLHVGMFFFAHCKRPRSLRLGLWTSSHAPLTVRGLLHDATNGRLRRIPVAWKSNIPNAWRVDCSTPHCVDKSARPFGPFH